MIFDNVTVSKMCQIRKISNKKFPILSQNLKYLEILKYSSFRIRKVKTDYSNRLKSGLGSDSGLGLEMNSIY